MTICNMTIEGGGRAGMIAPDDTTFEWVDGPRRRAPRRGRRRRAGASCAPTRARASTRRSTSTPRRCRRRSRGARRPARSSPVTERGARAARARADERALVSTWTSRPARRSRRSSSTASSSARARTRGSATCAPPPRSSTGRKVAAGRRRDGRARLAAGEGAGRGRGPRRGLPRRRLRLAHRRLLDVPGHEPGHRCSRASAAPRPRTATSRAARAAAGAPTSSRPQMAAAAAIEGHFVDIRELELGWSRSARSSRARLRARPRRRRHRPDHPQAVPQAGRAHRLRRVPVLRLGEGARLGPAREPDPRRRAQLRLRLARASTRRGRSRTTASGRSSRRASPTSSTRNCTKIGLLPVVLAEDDVKRADGRRRGEVDLEAQRCASAGREVSFEHRPGDASAGCSTASTTSRSRCSRPSASTRTRRERERSGPVTTAL